MSEQNKNAELLELAKRYGEACHELGKELAGSKLYVDRASFSKRLAWTALESAINAAPHQVQEGAAPTEVLHFESFQLSDGAVQEGGGEAYIGEDWELLAMALASEEHDDIHHLIWEGGPIKQPWGEVWQKYEDEAKRMIALVRKHVPATPPAPIVSAPVGEAAVPPGVARDAERYQELRAMCGTTGKVTTCIWGIGGNPHAGNNYPTAEELDAALDAIRASSTTPKDSHV